MCKIMMISDFKKFLKKQKTNKGYHSLLNEIKDIVTKHNDDGFGFSMSTQKDIFYYKQFNTYLDINVNSENYDSFILQYPQYAYGAAEIKKNNL